MVSPVSLEQLNQRIVACKRCPRLRCYCQHIATQKRARYREQTYWARPVPNFLSSLAPRRSPADRRRSGHATSKSRLLIVGLAPGAHGANRTGRMFTGDRSGEFLYRAMYETGFANQPTASDPGDGLTLSGAVITAALHCAPPANKPAKEELDRCRGFLEQTFDSMPGLRAVLCLGQIAHHATLKLYQRRGWIRSRSAYRFAHGASYFTTADAPPFALLCSYHPSQQNTFTGRLTHTMLVEVFQAAAQLLRRE